MKNIFVLSVAAQKRVEELEKTRVMTESYPSLARILAEDYTPVKSTRK